MREQVYVPLAGETVRSGGAGTDGGGDWANGRWVPSSRTRRPSLHDIHIKPAPVQEEALPPAPVETPQHYAQPYHYDASQQASTNFTQGNDMASNHHSGMPNPEEFDLYDPEQLGDFIQRSVQSALTPSRQAQSEAAMAEQYNATYDKFGSDANCKAVMHEALEACIRDANSGRPVNIEQRYLEASDSTSRRPGQRVSHLPAKAQTVRGLGALIDHNHRTGRARPYKSR